MQERRLSDIWSKAQPVDLDKRRHLMLTTRAWKALEEVYGNMAGALAGLAEMQLGSRPLTHCVNFLWAMLQQEAHKARETLTIEDVEDMITVQNLPTLMEAVVDTITAFYPPPDPHQPAAGMVSPGTGGGPMNSARQSTDGMMSGS